MGATSLILAVFLQLPWEYRPSWDRALEGPTGSVKGQGGGGRVGRGAANTPAHTGICVHSLTCVFSACWHSGAHCVFVQE